MKAEAGAPHGALKVLPTGRCWGYLVSDGGSAVGMHFQSGCFSEMPSGPVHLCLELSLLRAVG